MAFTTTMLLLRVSSENTVQYTPPLCRRVSLSNWKDLREGLLQDAIEGPLVKLASDTAGYVADDQF